MDLRQPGHCAGMAAALVGGVGAGGVKMSPDAPLRKLAAEAGIALAYHDVFGRHSEPSAEVLRELLTALEVLPEPGADAAAALAAWQGPRAREILDRKTVVQGNRR